MLYIENAFQKLFVENVSEDSRERWLKHSKTLSENFQNMRHWNQRDEYQKPFTEIYVKNISHLFQKKFQREYFINVFQKSFKKMYLKYSNKTFPKSFKICFTETYLSIILGGHLDISETFLKRFSGTYYLSLKCFCRTFWDGFGYWGHGIFIGRSKNVFWISADLGKSNGRPINILMTSWRHPQNWIDFAIWAA